MNEILNVYAQVLNLQWQLRAMVISQGIKIIDTINESQRFQRQHEENKKRIDFQYQQIIKQRRK